MSQAQGADLTSRPVEARVGANPLVSVVTPFYNTEDYLAECIASVLGQTYGNWEYVLVDNRSTDGSAAIARRYADRDPRVRLVENEQFLGQVENYNHALRQISAASKYCKIVQADDWIFPNCLEEMVRAAESHTGVALVGSYTLVGTQLAHGGLRHGNRPRPGPEVLRRCLAEGLVLFSSPTCVMYLSSQVRARRPFFSLESPVEDVEACFDVLLEGDMAFVHQVLTFTRRENESIWSGIERYNPMLLYGMILTHRYGPRLFTPAEFDELRSRIESKYYRFLGQAVFFQGRSRGFWKFHAKGLARAGSRIKKLTLARHILLALVDLLGNPKATLERLWGALGRRGVDRRAS